METTDLTREQPTTLRKYEGLGTAMVAEVTIGSALELESF